jgi:hypothetical protein
MSETGRGPRWRRQRRALKVLAAASLFCAIAYMLLSLLPLTGRLVRVAISRRSVAGSQPAKFSSSRRIYPYSVIRGGAYSAGELREALDRDPVAARHYLVFHRSTVRTTASSFSEPVFLSYRVGDAVYWTSRPVRLPHGETLLTDGTNYARARCGNRISQTPRTPVNDTEPAPEALDTPPPPANAIADLDTWSENRLLGQPPLLTQVLPGQPVSIISTVPALTLSGTVPPWWPISIPTGLLPLPAPPSTPILVGTIPVIQPTPIPGLILPPTPVEFPPGSSPPPPPGPSTPPTVSIVPPFILPPEIWPPVIPTIPGLPVIPGGPGTPVTPQIPIQPTGPLQPVPEPALLAPTLLAFAALAAARFRRRF